MSAHPRLLMVGFDAADGDLALRWIEEGKLPVLAGLAERGVALPLRSAGEHMPESSWASLVSGCTAGQHGVYSWRIVAPGTVDRVRTAGGGLRRPFWSLIRERGGDPAPRVTVVDVPYGGSTTDPGVLQLGGWGLRVTREITCNPPGLWEELAERHPRYPTWVNRDYVRGPLSERRYRRTLIDLADRRGALALDLLGRSPWDLAIVNFTEPHYAGHAFFHHLRRAAGTRARPRAGARTGLLDVYRAVDRNLGRLIAAAGPEANVIAFATIGLRPNEIGHDLLSRIMVALGYEVPSAAPARRSLRRRAVAAGTAATPRFLRHRLRALLPGEAVEGLADSAWGEAIDWERSRAVSEAEPGSAWIRLNLVGREPRGIVRPEERAELVRSVRADLGELIDEATGEPAVDEVLDVAEIAPGEAAAAMPDLLVRWRPGRRIRAVRHPRAGLITDGGGHYARTEHTGAGFLAAAGPAIAPGAGPDGGAREMDLAPTALQLFGCPIPRGMEGEPLSWLLRDAPETARVDLEIAASPSWAGRA